MGGGCVCLLNGGLSAIGGSVPQDPGVGWLCSCVDNSAFVFTKAICCSLN